MSSVATQDVRTIVKLFMAHNCGAYVFLIGERLTIHYARTSSDAFY